MNKEPKVTQHKTLILIIVLALLSRIIFLLAVSDIKNMHSYEYGEITKNLQHGNGYSLFYLENDSLKLEYKTGTFPYKSAYMPPGYTSFLYPFFIINNDLIRNLFISLIQILLSVLNVFLIYTLTRQMYSENAGIIAAFIYALLPEFIYASANINVVVLYHSGVLCLFYLLQKGKIFSDYKILSLFILISIFLIYLRFEFILFIVLLTLFFFKMFGIKRISIIYFFIIVALSPWFIRNYMIFRHFPLLSTSTGLNLYRGNNEYFVGCWGDDSLFAKLKSHQNSPDYEYEANRIYFKKAVNFISANPGKEVIYGLQKLYNLWVFNNDDKRTESFYYKIPVVVILVLFLLGLFSKISVDRFKYFYLFFVYFSLIAIIFFALPRYQTMLKVMIIPFAAQGAAILYDYVKLKFTDQ